MTSTTPQAAGSLRRASALMASGSMVSRILGIARNAMLTMCLGAYAINNSFSSANILPNYIYILLAGGLLNAILIPQITKAMKQADGGQAQIDRLLTLILLLIVPVGVLVTVFAGPIIRLIAQFQDPALVDLTVAFAYVTMPQVFFYCMYVLLGQILNARNQFAAFMWAPVLANVVQILGMAVWLWQFGALTDRSLHPNALTEPRMWTVPMILWLAGTSTLGIALQALVLVFPLARGGFRYRPRFDFRGHGLRQAGSMVGWAFGALVISQIGGLLAQTVLNAVIPKNASYAGYGIYTAMFTIFMIPHSLITTTLVTALFPRLSSAVHDGDVGAQRDIVRRCLTTPAVAIIPVTAAAIALARPGIKVLNPNYPESAVTSATLVFGIMVVGMWPFGIKSIQERYTFAREDGRGTLAYQVIVSGIALAFTGLAFVVPHRVAAATVALGLTVSSLVGALAFVVQTQRQLGSLGLRALLRLYVRLALAGTVAGLLAWLAASAVGLVLGAGWIASMVALAVGGPVFGVVFLVAASTLRIREVDELVGPVLARLRRTRPGRHSA